jgi:hypothetical protein
MKQSGNFSRNNLVFAVQLNNIDLGNCKKVSKSKKERIPFISHQLTN